MCCGVLQMVWLQHPPLLVVKLVSQPLCTPLCLICFLVGPTQSWLQVDGVTTESASTVSDANGLIQEFSGQKEFERRVVDLEQQTLDQTEIDWEVKYWELAGHP